MTSVQQQETTNPEEEHVMNEVIKRECVSMLKRHDDAIAIGNGAALYAALDSVRIEMLKRHVGIFPQISDMGILELCVNAQHRPVRNCDRFDGDKDMLIEACMRERGLLVTENFSDVFADWLLEPMKEGK